MQYDTIRKDIHDDYWFLCAISSFGNGSMELLLLNFNKKLRVLFQNT